MGTNDANRGAMLCSIRAAADEKIEDAADVELAIYDVVGGDFFGDGVTAKDVLNQLSAAKNAKTISVRINSVGGSVTDGFAIYNQLKKHQAHVIVDVESLAASIASVIAMSGDEIRMASNAMMMIHNPATISIGEADDLRKDADFLDKWAGMIAATYAARSDGDEEKFRSLMNAETWLSAQEALDLGLATSITPAKQMVAMAGFDLSKFENVPVALGGEPRAEDPQPDPLPHADALKSARRKLEDGNAAELTKQEMSALVESADAKLSAHAKAVASRSPIARAGFGARKTHIRELLQNQR